MTKNNNEEKMSHIILYPSDKNGCGFYRTFFPFRYLSTKYQKTYNVSEMTAFNFDFNYIRITDHIRFQRQVTIAQTKIISFIKEHIKKFNFYTKISYDLDDLVHEILPSNVPAYQFYTPIRKNNLIYILKEICDFVTYSTAFLKDYYESKFGIKNGYIIKNFLPKYLWGLCGKREKRFKDPDKKPRILWSGSSSHIGRGGDLEFLFPLIKKTKDEFKWVFFGPVPSEVADIVEKHEWVSVYEYPQKLDSIDADIAIAPIADNIFNMAKSDLKILEYSAVNLPVIASSIGNGKGPYDLYPTKIKLVENKIDDWYCAIKEMLSSETVYQNCLNAGRQELENRWLESEKNIGIYKDLFKSQT